MRVRYSPLQQLLHWLTLAMTAATLPVAWVMTASPDAKPGVEDLYNLHKTLGILILAVVAMRLVIRAVEGAPPLPAHVAGLERALAEATHLLLYVAFVAMAASGWIDAASSRHPTLFLDVLPLPQLPQDPAVHGAARQVHRTLQWTVYALIVLHILGVVVHTAFRRDGLLERMLPNQTPST